MAPLMAAGPLRAAWRPADVLNTGLLLTALFLLMRQQYLVALGSSPATVKMASPRWMVPAEVATAAAAADAAGRGVDSGTTAASPLPDSASCPPPAACPKATCPPAALSEARASSASSTPTSRFDNSRFSTSEARLKLLWRHPRVSHREWWKEVHNDSWQFLDSRQVARGVAVQGDPARLECLAAKLLDGRGIKLSILGGSVSFGTTFTTSKSHALYHWKLYQWINASFPLANPETTMHEHYCGAVPASGPSYMEHCLQWHVPQAADLIIVEYAVNFDITSNDDAQSFERMIRRLLRLRNAPAILILNTMELMQHMPGNRGGLDMSKIYFSGCTPYGCLDAPPWSNEVDLGFTWNAPAEDAILSVAQYYAVPCVSLRSALFSELKQNSSRFPLKKVFHDRHHPAAWGHSLMAQLLIGRLRAAVATVVERRAAAAAARSPPPGDQCASIAAEVAAATKVERESSARGVTATSPQSGGSMLGPPLLSKSVEAPVGLCLKGDELTRAMLNTSTFAFRIEGTDAKMKPGIIGTKPGEHAEFCLDVARLQPGESFAALLGHLVSYEHMGKARVTCSGDCRCEPTDVDAFVKGGQFSVFKAHVIDMHRVSRPKGAPPPPRQACGCVMKVTILPESGSGEFKFKVLSLMTASRKGELKWGHQAGFNVRPTEPRIDK